MSRDDQVLRLICVGAAFLGACVRGISTTTAGRKRACVEALTLGQTMFETVTGSDVWPVERDAPEPERVPVYRLRNGAEHFYTADANERDSAVSQYGYVLEGIAFYAFKTEV